MAHRGVVPELLQAGLRVTAMDISPLIVAEAAARHPSLEAVQADVRRLPFPDGRFDAVFSGSTLDHLASKAEIAVALAELARVLRPGGQLILTLDNPGNPLILLRNGPLLRLWRRLGIVPYQVGCTLALGPLLALLRASGFRVREARGFQHCPRLLCVALARACGPLPRSWREAFLAMLSAWDRLERWPSRWLTAHYIAIHAEKG